MKVRYYIDPQTDVPHICGHDVSELEVEEVLEHAVEDYPGIEGSRVAIGPISTGRTLRVVYAPGSWAERRVRDHRVRSSRRALTRIQAAQAPETPMSKQARFPPGWDEERVRRVLKHYESQPEEQAVAEDEAGLDSTAETVMNIPKELVPEVRKLIARHKKGV